MNDKMFLFTLHESEEDFRIEVAVLAWSPREAASILGGEFIEVENQPPASSTNFDDLNLSGKIYFAPKLFRSFTGKELNDMKLDYNPGEQYSKGPDLTIWAKPGEEGRTFVLRINFVTVPQYVLF